MKNHKHTSSVPDFSTLPYIYGRRAHTGATSVEQPIPLFLPEAVYPPELEELKKNDPDSYRMVIYSWG